MTPTLLSLSPSFSPNQTLCRVFPHGTAAAKGSCGSGAASATRTSVPAGTTIEVQRPTQRSGPTPSPALAKAVVAPFSISLPTFFFFRVPSASPPSSSSSSTAASCCVGVPVVRSSHCCCSPLPRTNLLVVSRERGRKTSVTTHLGDQSVPFPNRR